MLVGVTTVFAELKMNWTASVGRPTLTLGLGFVISATLFTMIYKLMPRAHLQWKDVWGALSLPHCCSAGQRPDRFVPGRQRGCFRLWCIGLVGACVALGLLVNAGIFARRLVHPALRQHWGSRRAMKKR